MQNMLLKATELGVASAWVSAFDETKLKVHLNIPEHIRPQGVITLGYSDEVAVRPPIKAFFDYCYFETYGNHLSPNMRALSYRQLGHLYAHHVHKAKHALHDLWHRLRGKGHAHKEDYGYEMTEEESHHW